MLLQTWSELLAQTFQDAWLQIALFAPKIIFAVVVFLVGWIAGSVFGGVVSQALRAMKVDQALRNIGLDEIVERSGYRLDAGHFLGTLVRWFITVVFLIVSVDILGLSQVNLFLQQVVVSYLPQVIVAVIILLLGAVIGDVVQKLVIGSAKVTGALSVHFAGAIARWSIWIFSILAALYQLGIADELIQIFFTGLVAMLALAGGIAFGLGGKDAAGKWIDRIAKEMSGK